MAEPLGHAEHEVDMLLVKRFPFVVDISLRTDQGVEYRSRWNQYDNLLEILTVSNVMIGDVSYHMLGVAFDTIMQDTNAIDIHVKSNGVYLYVPVG